MRPWTTASAHHPAQDGHRTVRPSTTASAHHPAQDGHQTVRPSTTASAHHPAQDGHQTVHPSTTASAHHPAQDGHQTVHPSTTASAHHHAQDGHQTVHPSTTASAHHHAQDDRRPFRAHPNRLRRREDHAALPTTRDRTEASRRRVRARSATIRGPGPRAGCLDRMSRSLCSCRPRGPDDVCGVVGRARVLDQASRSRRPAPRGPGPVGLGPGRSTARVGGARIATSGPRPQAANSNVRAASCELGARGSASAA